MLEKFGLPVDLIEKCYDGESAVQMFEKSLTKMKKDQDSGYVVDRSEMYFLVLMDFSMP